MDDQQTLTPPGGPGAGKKKQTPAGRYKAMVKPQTPVAKQDTLPWVQKADGSVGPWGNDPNKPASPPPAPLNGQPKMSDKANGTSSTYYSANSQQQKPAVPIIKKSPNYN